VSLYTVESQKEEINDLIAEGLKEILHTGFKINDKTLGSLEDDISVFMSALQKKNKIYDYAVHIVWDDLFNKFQGKLAYVLINTKGFNAFEANKFEELIEFSF
jgi:hypothetical protein